MLNENQVMFLKEKGIMPGGVRTKGGSSNNSREHHEPFNENSEENQPLKNRVPGGDLLSQWRQKKRSRGYRTVVEDSSKKSTPIDMHAKGTVKQTLSTRAQVTVQSRNTILLRPCTPEDIRRNSEDLPASACNGLSFNQRLDRHSPASSEKPEKTAPCNAHNNGASADCMAPNSTTPSETEAFAQPTEKMNLDLLEWPRIFVSLSRKEKEDDFFIIKGSKLPQRPKKRPKVVEKNLQNCYPGIWLSDVARGRYEVREKKCTRKKPRGLKAMECLESDSD